MDVLFFLLAWLLVGAGVAFVAFTGGPGRARQAYLTRGGRAFRVSILLLYAAVGVGVPAYVIANREQAVGTSGALASEEATGQVKRGKELFLQTCSSCHTLAEANAQGITGPDLDQVGALSRQRVLNAIRIGGTGQKRMPAGLLDGENAEAVATYVSRVAGR
jgi:mono/diheme cytochrome c family protein